MSHLGIGDRQFWGFSPAQSVPLLHNSDSHILLLGESDIRHLIYTLFQQCGDNSTANPLHFYINETCLEVLCRQMILLHVFLDAALSKDHFEQIFLEIYANTMISDRSNDYLMKASQKWSRFIGFDEDIQLGEFSMKRIVNLQSFKHKERDFMEKIFRDIATDASLGADQFKIEEMRDIQVRQMYKDRYDVRENLFDWDYHMKLAKLHDARIIHDKEYANFRMKGIAYQFTGDNVFPNWTLRANVLKRNASNQSVVLRGYFGDIVCGPFQNFGLYTTRQDLMKKNSDGTHAYPSLFLAQHNLSQYRKTVLENASKLDFSVHFMMSTLDMIAGKSVNRNRFGSVYVGCMQAQWIGLDRFTEILAKGARVYVETVKFILPLSHTQKIEFYKQILALGEKSGLHVVEEKENDTSADVHKKQKKTPTPEETEPGLKKHIVVLELPNSVKEKGDTST